MPAEVIDLFCGIGGLTHGLINAGMNVIAGFDIDPTCQYTYEHNNHCDYHIRNIRDVQAPELEGLYNHDAIRVLVGCAPCQPFSQMRFKLGDANAKDEKYNLLLEFGRLIEEMHPTVVSMENVPQIRESNVFQEFIDILIQNGYFYDSRVIYCPDYGIAQSRRRFVLVGSLLGPINIIQPTHRRENVHVRDYIGGLPPIGAGEVDEHDPLHRSAILSELNLRRIRASVPGGTWRDWPEELRCNCHKKK